jgi:hypothetical protein
LNFIFNIFSNNTEFLGLVASVIVAISLIMNSVLKLRILNLIGSFVFAIYGYFIRSYPVLFLNIFICFINIYYIVNIVTIREYFSIFEFDKNSLYMQKFLSFYENDIKKFNESFDINILYKDLDIFFILRDLIPAGIFIVENRKDYQFVHLDYVIPKYRDLRIAEYLFYKNREYFEKKNYKKFVTKSKNKHHIKYLLKIGFKNIGKEEEYFVFEKKL